jgi:hypothetical protein
MRDQSAAESSAVSWESSFPLPGADVVAAAWSNRSPDGGFPQHPEKAHVVSAALLALGAALLLFVPLGGALLLVSGGLGLAIAWEAPMLGLTTATQPQAPSPTNH